MVSTPPMTQLLSLSLSCLKSRPTKLHTQEPTEKSILHTIDYTPYYAALDRIPGYLPNCQRHSYLPNELSLFPDAKCDADLQTTPEDQGPDRCAIISASRKQITRPKVQNGRHAELQENGAPEFDLMRLARSLR